VENRLMCARRTLTASFPHVHVIPEKTDSVNSWNKRSVGSSQTTFENQVSERAPPAGAPGHSFVSRRVRFG